MPMLRLHPEKRSGARELLDHSWIEGIVVQGEIEQAMRQAGIDVDALTAGSPSGMSLPPGLTPSEADALKPVGSVSSSPAPLALNMQGLEDAKRRAAQHQADAAAAVAASQNGALQTTKRVQRRTCCDVPLARPRSCAASRSVGAIVVERRRWRVAHDDQRARLGGCE
ncbi:hypothetical protein L1887_51753 [Cichorium endivia]|nr:hypothetical protein L1887_51753 [Cichorium endivia]